MLCFVMWIIFVISYRFCENICSSKEDFHSLRVAFCKSSLFIYRSDLQVGLLWFCTQVIALASTKPFMQKNSLMYANCCACKLQSCVWNLGMRVSTILPACNCPTPLQIVWLLSTCSGLASLWSQASTLEFGFLWVNRLCWWWLRFMLA